MNQNDILEIIIDNIRQIVPGLEDHAFKPSDRMTDLGLNSMDRTEVLMMTLERLNLNVALVDIAPARNIGELASLVYAKSQV